MSNKRKLEKIKRMMKASGIVDGFEEMLRLSTKNISAHLAEMKKLIDNEDLFGSDGYSAHMNRQTEKIKDEASELYVNELLSKKDEILDAFALIYDRYLDETCIDALYELYSSDAWKEMIKFQPTFQQAQFEVMSKFNSEATMKVLEYAMSKELEMRAKHLAKRVFGQTVENGASFSEALDAYCKKYWQIIKAE